MKQVIVVRKDLNMTPGKAAAQCCHASLTSFINARGASFRETMDWFNEGQTKIIVMVDDEKQLLEIYEKVKSDKELKSRYALIRDAGHTELKGQNLTCLGIGPAKESDIDQYTGKLKLYR